MIPEGVRFAAAGDDERRSGAAAAAPHPWSEPFAAGGRTTPMNRRRSLVLLVALVSASAVALLGRAARKRRRGRSASRRPRGTSTPSSKRSRQANSRAVVARLERRVEGAPHDPDDLAQLGLGYLQLAARPGAVLAAAGGRGPPRSLEDGERRGLALTGLAQLANAQHRFRAAIPPPVRAAAHPRASRRSARSRTRSSRPVVTASVSRARPDGSGRTQCRRVCAGRVRPGPARPTRGCARGDAPRSRGRHGDPRAGGLGVDAARLAGTAGGARRSGCERRSSMRLEAAPRYVHAEVGLGASRRRT